MSKYENFQGTAREFVEAGVTLNGVVLDAVDISILARHQIIKQVGIQLKANPSKRGRDPFIYLMTGKSGFNVHVPPKAVVETPKQQQTLETV